MPRPRESLTYNYFRTHKTLNINKCNVCGGIVKGRPHAGNFYAHLKRHHPEIQIEIDEEPPVKQKKMTEFVSVQKEEYVMVKFSKKDLERSALTLVTTDGRPFSCVEDKGYKMLANRIKAKWNKQYPQKKVAINRHNVSKLVKEEAREIVDLITREVRGKMVCVKIDCAARFDRSFLGINIQYRNDKDVLKVYTVGVIETFSEHTGEYLLEELKIVLFKFGIEIDQIYAVTIDNGANMVKMCALLNDQLADQMKNQTPAISPSSTTLDREEESEEFYLAGMEEHEVTAFSEYQEKVIESMETEFKINDVIPTIRCAAHTLQLAIFDTLKSEKKPLNRVLEKVRDVVVKLRTPKNRKKLRSVDAKAPVLANATRWSSSGLMVDRFSILKPKIEELGDKGVLDLKKIKYDAITKNDWLRLKFARKALEKCKIATIRLQREDLTLNEFFTIWTTCQFQISQLNSKFAERLENNMKKRQKKLLDENEPLIASLLLDPRYKSVLSSGLTNKAMDHIQTLYGRIVSVEEKSSQDEPQSSQQEKPTTSKSSFSEYLKKSMRETATASDKGGNIPGSIHQELCDFISTSFDLDLPGQSAEEFDLMRDFWIRHKYKFPLLYKVAKILLSVPATQTTVERLFSHLHFILTDLRTNLSGENLDDILLVRWNNAH